MARRVNVRFIERKQGSINDLTSPLIGDKAKFRQRLRADRAIERAAAGGSQPKGAVLEAIIGRRDETLPFYALELGAQLGRAVCKVAFGSEDAGSGTGFLIGPNLLLTNNHVLPTVERARQARCIFDFELGTDRLSRKPIIYSLNPDSLFLTSDCETGLDYTVVRIDTAASADRAPIPLSRGSFTALPPEWTFVVQHPSGEMKRVALCDSKIIGDSGVTLHYLADTRTGSSGSPVFNSDWQLVGLHHSAQPTAKLPLETRQAAGDETLVNEGIKLAAIACDLELRTIEGSAMAGTVLGLFEGTDSLLGYFGALGRSTDKANALDRVRDIYSATDRDVDIGYWRIEDFASRYLDITPRIARQMTELMLDVYVMPGMTADAAAYLIAWLRDNYGVELQQAMADGDPNGGHGMTSLLWNADRIERAALDWPPPVDGWFAIDASAMAAGAGRLFARRPIRCRLAIKALGTAAPYLLNLVAVDAGTGRDSAPRQTAAMRITYSAIAAAIRQDPDGDWLVCGAIAAPSAACNPASLPNITRIVPLADQLVGTATYLATTGSAVGRVFIASGMTADPADADLVAVAGNDKALARIEHDLGCRPLLLRLSFAQRSSSMATLPEIPPELAIALQSAG